VVGAWSHLCGQPDHHRIVIRSAGTAPGRDRAAAGVLDAISRDDPHCADVDQYQREGGQSRVTCTPCLLMRNLAREGRPSMQKRRTVYVVAILLVALAVGLVIAIRRGPDPSGRADLFAQTRAAAGARRNVIDTALFRTIAKRQNPIVVYITTQTRLQAPDLTEFFEGDDFLRRFFGGPMPPREQVHRGLGSGFLISEVMGPSTLSCRRLFQVCALGGASEDASKCSR
jgi:hypothetical protein